MTPGRNEPCPCGSGKKYKNCHGAPSGTRAPSPDAAWDRVRAATAGFPALMARFVRQAYGPDAIHEAWDEFTLWGDEGARFDPDSPHLPVFLPWFYHQWTPDPLETDVADDSLHDHSPTSALLQRRGRRLDPVLRRHLEACLESPFSFHEILAVEPGRGFDAEDVFTGEEREVLERSASRTLRPGDLLYGQLVTSEGITVLEACSSHALPPQNRIYLVDLRERIAGGGPPPDAWTLMDWDIEIREEYLGAIDALISPIMPKLKNTDGEVLVFHTLSFDVPSAQAAFEALRHLALDEPEDDLLETAERDADGRLHSVSLPWKVAGNRVHASWENTVHGILEIDGGRLVASVNSVERAERIRALVEASLPTARHTGTEVETVEEALARRDTEEVDEAAQDGPALPPEARELARAMIAAHYQGWADEAIPALGGITPAEAVRDPVGREKVEALLAQIERDGRRLDPPLDEAVTRGLRRRLGLSEPRDA